MNTYDTILSNTKFNVSVDKSLSEIRLIYTEIPTNKLLCTGGLIAVTFLACKSLNMIEDLIIDSRNRKASKEPDEPEEPKKANSFEHMKASRIIHNL